MFIKKLPALLIVGAMIASMLIGCGGGKTNASSSEQSYTIKFMSWHGEDSDSNNYKGLKAIADDYTALHPNVNISFVFQPLDGYLELLDTQFISGSAPEIIHMQPWMVKLYADKDVLYNLTNAFDTKSDYADTDKWIDSFIGGASSFTSAKSQNKYGGIFFVPNDGNPKISLGQPMLYNKDMFAAAGLDPEATPKDWEEFMTICQALKDSGVIPVAADNGRWIGWSLGGVTYQFGEKYVDQFFSSEFTGENGTDFYYDKVYISLANGDLKDAPFYSDMLSIWKDYSQYWQNGWTGTSDADAPNLVLMEKAAMVQIGFWDHGYYKNTIGDAFNWGVFPVPVITTETSQYAIGKYDAPSNQQDYGFAINGKVSDDPGLEAVVLDFMKFLSSKEEQEKYVNIVTSLSPIEGVSVPEELSGYTFPVDLATASEVVGGSFIEWGDGSIWPGLAQDYLTGNLSLEDFISRTGELSQTTGIEYCDQMLTDDGFPALVAEAEQKLEDMKSANADPNAIASQEKTVELLKLRMKMMQDSYVK